MKYLIITIISLSLLTITTSPIIAQEMQSPQYKLESGTVEMESPAAKENDLLEAKPQLSSQDLATFKEQGFLELTNTQLRQAESAISLSAGAVEFADLIENHQQTKLLEIRVPSQLSFNYALYLSKDDDFQSPAGQKINNTLCNNPRSPCLAQTAKPWTAENAYGVGYRLTGNNIPIEFSRLDNYRPFPNNNTLLKLLTYKKTSAGQTAALTVKINIPVEKADSSYITTISLMTIPEL